MLPWGTPLITQTADECAAAVFTNWERPIRKLYIQPKIKSSTP